MKLQTVRNFRDGRNFRALSTEQMEKQRRNRERRARAKSFDEREVSGGKTSKILLLFYNTVYSVILCLELYCSSIAKKFAILLFTIP